MLKRKIEKELLEWKNTKHNECLLVKGARQVGKTYIIDKFGKDNYKNYVYINFFENPNYKNIFEGSLQADDIYKRMSIYIPNLKLEDNQTLIFLDEIQECPNARTALKFLAIDNRFDIIASGSLLGIGYKNIASVPVGYEKQITLYPLDLEEYLWAIGMNSEAIDYIRDSFVKQNKLENGVNDEILNKMREYMVVGGMPDVVNRFLETKNFSEVQKAQDKILDSYYDDISKYADTHDKPKIRKCYLSIPKQLAKENKKFQYSVVDKGATAWKFGESIQWLIDANLVTEIHNVSTPQFPLNAYEREDYFKLYLNDIGLLTAMYGFELKKAILENTLSGPAKGGIYENLISDILTKRGFKLYYYKNDSSSQEIEFLLSRDSKVIPLEVKSGNGTSVSLNNFILDYNPPYAYKLITGNLGVSGIKITMPLYMAMFI